MKKLILATTSIPRRESFDEMQISYEAIGSDVDEYTNERPNEPKELVLYLSKLKAEAVAKNNKYSIVVGFDSVAYLDGNILEKPKSREEAFERLRKFSGNSYKFFTGVYLIDGDFSESRLVETKAKVRNLSSDEINKYLDQDTNFKRYAQGFNPLNTFGASFIERIEGSYNNILRGIPLEVIVEMINRRNGYGDRNKN